MMSKIRIVSERNNLCGPIAREVFREWCVDRIGWRGRQMEAFLDDIPVAKLILASQGKIFGRVLLVIDVRDRLRIAKRCR